ncbi:hypothetical protein AB0K16_22520 [Nonomuraea jabiensis]|uniref:hypothetical protein n=1 Tax=Nonomuraea jabiensis TaxID=882448 RepID=UPI003441C961
MTVESPNQNVNVPGAGNWNLPFDPRLVTYGGIGTVDSRGNGMNGREVALRRGYIRTDTQAKNGWGENTPNRWLYFLYNPATIATNYSMQDDPGAVITAFNNSQGKYMGLLTQSLDFSLLFDRTYEVMDGSREGAWRDIRAALAIIGVLNNVGEGAMYTTGSDFDAGPMVYMPSYFHFGNQTGGVTYYGYITNLSYEITHFSKDMVPVRVGMRISVNMLPTGNGFGASAEAGSTPSQEQTGPLDERGFPGATNLTDESLSDMINKFGGNSWGGPDARIWN